MVDVMLGARVAVECSFRVAGVLADPTVITCIVKAPSGDVSTYVYPAPELSRDAVGVYRAEFSTTQTGAYWVRFEGTGDVEAVQETPVQVLQSNVI